jgi:ribosomal protein L29
MKLTKFRDELKRLDAAELKVRLDATRRELFNIQLNATTAHVKDYSQFKKLRKNIARVLTFARQKEHEKLK